MLLTPQEFLEIYQGKGRFGSGFKELDDLLGGGFIKGRHVQVHGLPGTAKTYLWFYPRSRAYTMGNFPALLLKNLCHDLNTLSRFLVVRSFTVESLLKDLQEMLPYQVPLIVIDHIAAPFRAFRSIETVAERVEAIEAVGRGFRKLGRGRPTLFLYINQLTTRFIQQSDGTGRIPLLVPALGESWSIFCDVDIRLEYNCKTQERRLTIVRADYIEEHQVGKSLRFQITVINLS